MMVGQLLATRGDEKSAAPPLGCTGSSACCTVRGGFHVHPVLKKITLGPLLLGCALFYFVNGAAAAQSTSTQSSSGFHVHPVFKKITLVS
ncbi:unnamed protein product [Amoebophrya sp. A120]|nr:unnamed protein product [Amoebophrya sp. A120]CAD7976347.1 unnamed protein product [Amoebophrya sp. A120]|eukprot:GSA120T00026347001.1